MDFGEPSRNGKNAMNFQYFFGGVFVSKNVPNLIPLKANMTTEASPFLIGDAVHLHSWLEFSSVIRSFSGRVIFVIASMYVIFTYI